MKALVVDDSEVSLVLLGNWLRRGGYEVRTARNGVEALQALADEPVDLIISDALMPEMDGFELCYHIKSNPATRHIPFVFCSADYTSPLDEQFARKMGASHYIVKGDDSVAFIRDLEQALADTGQPDPAPSLPEVMYLREYVARLTQKLGEKVRALEHTNEQLEESNRKLQEVTQRTSEEWFRVGIESVPDAIVVINRDGAIVFFNAQVEKLFGYHRDELRHLPVESLMPERFREVHIGHRVRYIADPHARPMGTGLTLVGRRKDGSEFPIEISLSPIETEKEILVAAAVRDITKRKQLEEQFYQAQKMEAVGRLAGGIAHDFNNLLTVIISWSELLLDRSPADDPRRRPTEEIEKAARRAASLTDQLLAFSRKQLQQLRVLDLNAVMGEMASMLQRLIGEDVELVTVLNSAAPKVHADLTQIQQVLMNLAVNARDAMPRGGCLTIETADADLDEPYAAVHSGVQPGAYVLLAVSDTGVGMDEATRDQIFEPFFTTKELGKGTGLGLATVYGIVKQSGGHIWVYSEPGQGTTFKIYLPRVPMAAALLREDWREPAPRGSETVLVVEDLEALRGVAQEILERKGYQMLAASDGEEALRIATEHEGPIHLLLTDVVMPKMSGRELCDRLAPLHPEMQVLYMSGYADSAIVNHGILDAGTFFIRKPFTPDSLARKVREALAAHKP